MQRRAAVFAAVALAAFASAPAAAGPKKYFLTVGAFPAAAAPEACGKGYHMASLFELVDLAPLAYDTKRGRTVPGAGSGPPAGVSGWIRNGGEPDTSTSPGYANCSAWTSADPGEYGSVVELPLAWDGPATAISPWVPDASPCTTELPVWCRQN